MSADPSAAPGVRRLLGRTADRSSGPPSWRRVELAAFVLVPLVVLVVVATSTIAVSERIARKNAITQAEQIATRFSRLLLAPLLDGALAAGSDDWDELEDLVTNRLSDGSISYLVVWSPEGQILFSSDEGAVGERYEPSDDLVAAGAGRTIAKVEDHPEESYEGSATGPLVEVYVPLELADQQVVVETYFSYDGIERQTADLRRQIIPLTVGALVVLQLVQLPIAMSLARRSRRQETERAQLMARSLTASERERQTIAADVHDGPVQDLAGVSYALSALRASVPDDRKAGVDRMVAAVRNAVHALRALMVDLYPPDLSGAGLEAALEDLVEPLRNQGLTANLRIALLPELSPASAAVVYRTAKELLANVGRHAEAANVWVDLAPVEGARPAAVRLTVSDDGVGLPSTGTDRRSEGHLGLRLVIDRVRDVGGTIAGPPDLGGTRPSS
jgi:two-component system NarL family sensor kinase